MERKKVLLLLDLNGTIAYRSEAAVAGVPPLLYLRHKNFYPRMGIDSFVKEVGREGDFLVAIYTSVMRHNVMPFVQALFPDERGIFKIFDRNFNKEDPNAVNEWDTIRDLSKIWASVRGFDATNTILIDNETRKFCETPRNGIVVPEYGAAEVKAKKSNTLQTLQRYLISMKTDPRFGTASFDVREYMEEFPFDPNMSLEVLTDKLRVMELKKSVEKPFFQRCLDLQDLGGRSVVITEVDGLTIRYFGFGDTKINVWVDCKEGFTFKEKMQLALLLSFRKSTAIKLEINGEPQTEDESSSSKGKEKASP